MLKSRGFKRPDLPPRSRPALVPLAEPSRAVMARADAPKRQVITVQKTPDRVKQAIRDSARSEECTVRIVGACTHDPATTIWSHAPLGAAGKGGAIKALDLCGAYCCTACDAVVDGQRPLPPGASRASVLADWFMGHMRSLVRLRQKGLV
jgi:hypothetical protein